MDIDRRRFLAVSAISALVPVSNWTKGVVCVNGHNLGRYWTIGPQHRLYCPASWLRRGTNNIVIFDLHQTTAKPISLASTLA